MVQLVLALDAAATFRNAVGVRSGGSNELLSAALLAELAGADAVRIGVNEAQRPVSDADVMSLCGSLRRFELRMAPSQSLLKLALEVRPDQVVLAGDPRDPAGAGRPVEFGGGRDLGLEPILHGLGDAGIPVAARITPDLDAVKAAHTLGLRSVELYTGDLLDLPRRERAAELESLGDAARIAAKLRMSVGLGGGLDFANVGEIQAVAPVARTLTVGRALLGRAMLVGIDRAVRDFRSQLG